MIPFFLGEDVSWHFLINKGENQTVFVIPLPSVDANISKTFFILFTQYLAQGSLRCLLGTLGRNVCSFNKTGTRRRGNLHLFGYLSHGDLDT